ncbi:hypothetical protein NDU88_007630 [Pleurodeles waltl]|uniref:Uncharacterized protein n=1 Tax=Pleurodeles waltl TaxID=8319 RepID=A0AAV7QL81_PLEWA|nr:hypothetical protein NDU88_007630 [Pleurodeles waltl]
MCGEDRSPILGPQPRRRREDRARSEKGPRRASGAVKWTTAPAAARADGIAGPCDMTVFSITCNIMKKVPAHEMRTMHVISEFLDIINAFKSIEEWYSWDYI